MAESTTRDVVVGLFVLAGLAAVAYLSVNLGGVTLGGPETIRVTARFDEVGGLKARAPVVVGGVKVGEVESVRLGDALYPVAELRVRADVPLPVDTSASILTAGVLGDQYVALQLGAEEDVLRDGDAIHYTQSAVILERLIGKMVQNLGAGEEP